MPSLAGLLEKNRCVITKRLHLSKGLWCDLLKRVCSYKEAERLCKDEEVWTFLAACGYAIAGSQGVKKLTKILTGLDLTQPEDAKIWLEALPFPPR